MLLKHPIRCLSAGFNHAGSRPVAQEIRASPSCRAASGRRHRDECGSDLRKRTSLDTRVMYLDRDFFHSLWLWFANYRHVELWNPGRRARGLES